MARAKRASDEIYNARRRVRRAAAAAERRGETERARQLRRLAEETYVGRGAQANVTRGASAAAAALREVMRASAAPTGRGKERSRQQGHELLHALRQISRTPSVRGSVSALTEALRASRVQRDNEIFARQLNTASAGGASSLDRADLSGKAQARIFWMSTRKLWMGERPEDRYGAIMRAFGTDSLRDAFEQVVEYNAQAVEQAVRVEAPLHDTLTQMADERMDETVVIGSPPEFLYFVRDASNIVNLMP